MLYTYDANGEGEITVPEGRELVIIEPDGKSSITAVYRLLIRT
jgi:hypothetical protein